MLQETAYPSLAYGLFGLGRFLQQIPDSYKRVIFMSICGSIRLSLDRVRVSDVAHTNPKVTAQTSSTEVSFIPMAALSAGYISQIALDAKRSWGTVKNGYTKFIEGDVLLAKITPCFQNRKSAIAKKLSNGIGCGSSEFHVLRVNENIVTQEYLLMFLKSQWFITYGVENFKGTAGQQRLGTSDLKNCLFPLPPMSEQHRIVAKLNELLDSVKHLEYNVSKT